MKPGFKLVEGFLWPDEDVDAAAVIPSQRADMDVAIKYCRGLHVVVQAGGNAGMWPRRMARIFSQVYTFEPEPKLYECLQFNCAVNGIMTFPYALGAVPGRAALEFPETRRNLGATCLRPGGGPGEIAVWTIDNLDLRACDLIQLDIEGYEPLALLGAKETIAKYRPVLMLEDKNLSAKYGYPQGFWRNHPAIPGYKLMDTINRDVILVPGEV
jgi:FkbM family methyltransferase